MRCLKCFTDNATGAKFCSECGSPLDQSPSIVAPVPVQAVKQEKSPRPTIIVQKKSSLPSLLLVLGLFALLAVMGVIALKQNGYEVQRQTTWLGQEKPIIDVSANDSSFSGKINLPKVKRSRNSAREDSPPPPEQSTSYGQAIPPASFTVSPGQYFASHFNVSGRGHVTGGFTASSDLNVYVVDEEGYANMQRGGFRSYYASGKVVSGRINLNLAPGSYYLVFSNTFSILTSKNVNANITLED